MTPEAEGGPPARLLGLLLIVIGGIHYGYNIAVVGAALPALRLALPNIASTDVGMLSGSTLLGAIIGSPISGLFCLRFGRRASTILGETCSTLGAVGCALSSTVPMLAAFRMLVGVGVGFCTLAKPLYVRETVSAYHAAGVQASFAPAVASGIVVAQAAGGLLTSWRLLFLLGALPPIILLAVGIFWMPESPQWLASRRANLVTGPTVRSKSGRGTSLAATFAPVRVAVWLAIANQLTGAYPVLVYSPELVRASLDEEASAPPSLVPVVATVANLLGACIAVRVSLPAHPSHLISYHPVPSISITFHLPSIASFHPLPSPPLPSPPLLSHPLLSPPTPSPPLPSPPIPPNP